MILCIVDDLMFASKISAAAKSLQRSVAFERSADNVVERVRRDAPSLVIFDLNSRKLRPLDVIGALKADPDLRATRMIGFVSHVDADTIAAARQAGIDEVLARSAFTERLGEILSSAT